MKENKPYSHDRLQQECFIYLWNKYPQTRMCCWHTPNEFIPDTFIQQQVKAIFAMKQQLVPVWLLLIFDLYKKHFISHLSKRKSIGVLAGVTDLTFYWAGCLYMFDVKLPGDSLSEQQLKFIACNEKQGGKFYEINKLEQFHIVIDDIFSHSI